MKKLLVNSKVMAYYNVDAEIRLIVDASPVGLGAIFTQKQQDGSYRPVSYANRSLTDVKCRYSQTEKEALTLVSGCERFKLYLYGKEFKVQTDHKAQEMIYSVTPQPPQE